MKRKVAYFIITPVLAVQDEDGNLLGVEQRAATTIYYPYQINLAEAAEALNRELEETE